MDKELIKIGDSYGDFVAVSDWYIVIEDILIKRSNKNYNVKFKYINLKCKTCSCIREVAKAEVRASKGMVCHCNKNYRKHVRSDGFKEINKWFEDFKREAEQPRKLKLQRRT